MAYRQEYYAGRGRGPGEGAERRRSTASVPYGDFTDALQTEDTTPLEPGLVEHKFYARDVGPVLAWR